MLFLIKKKKKGDENLPNLIKYVGVRQGSHTWSRSTQGDEASPSSKLSIKSGKIISTISDLFTATFKLANKRMPLS